MKEILFSVDSCLWIFGVWCCIPANDEEPSPEDSRAFLVRSFEGNGKVLWEKRFLSIVVIITFTISTIEN